MQLDGSTPGLLGLPQSGGWLPLWLLFTGVLSTYNVLQTYLTPGVSKRIYGRQPEQVTPLANHLFASWTLAQLMIRMTLAYNISDENLYRLCLGTWVIAWFHFLPELLIFRTAGPGPIFAPITISVVTFIWMVQQYDFYVR